MTKANIKTNKGLIIVNFYDKDTPNTVKNFVTLVESGYYNGVVFHRVINDFMIQGGDQTGTGSGSPGYKFADETVNSMQKHLLGSISMANSGPNTNGSQFFIVLNPNSCKHLDGKHTVFGKVSQGMEVVQKIVQGDKMIEVSITEKSDFITSYEFKKLP